MFEFADGIACVMAAGRFSGWQWRRGSTDGQPAAQAAAWKPGHGRSASAPGRAGRTQCRAGEETEEVSLLYVYKVYIFTITAFDAVGQVSHPVTHLNPAVHRRYFRQTRSGHDKCHEQKHWTLPTAFAAALLTYGGYSNIIFSFGSSFGFGLQSSSQIITTNKPTPSFFTGLMPLYKVYILPSVLLTLSLRCHTL